MPLLGCIADDFTGGTDLAGALVKAGMRTIQTDGVPRLEVSDVDAVVIALKSRTGPSADAVRDSIEALNWLKNANCRQFYFKYCSTFDSSSEGNIGSVADAMLDALQTNFTIICPAFPTNGRTIYKGRLFVGDIPLDESSMRYHPLTPMVDSSLMRLMQAQTRRKVGLVDYQTTRQGASAVRNQFSRLQDQGVCYAIVDAISDEDLVTIGTACSGMRLVTGGSGVAGALPMNFQNRAGRFDNRSASSLPAFGGRRAVIAGSCASATQRQVALMQQSCPSFKIDAIAIAAGDDVVGNALRWARGVDGVPLFYATAAPGEVRRAQTTLGRERAGQLIEHALSSIAKGLVENGIDQLIVAGGETSGSVVKSLDVAALRIGPEIEPGVPWTMALYDRPGPNIALALKSGNFGSDRFFLDSWVRLESEKAGAL